MGKGRLDQFPALDRVLRGLDVDSTLAVILFGSSARGDGDERSDVDILVVVDTDESKRRLIGWMRNEGVEPYPLVLSERAMLHEVAARPSFVSHLLHEGRILYEHARWQDMQTYLGTAASDPEALSAEVRTRGGDLSPLCDVERFAGSPVTLLSHLFGVARSLVIARLLELGVHEYSWTRAFDRYAEFRPDLKTDLHALKGLRPYYEYARSRPGAQRPTDMPALSEVRRLIAVTQQLAA